MSDTISEALGMTPRELTPIPRNEISEVPNTSDEFNELLIKNRKSDYVMVRDNIAQLIMETQTVVEEAVKEVRSNPSARMFETFATLIKTYSELNKDLLEITNPVEEKTQTTSPVNNAFFIGTNESLIDQIKRM